MYAVQLTPGAARFFEDADAPLQKKLDRCFAQLADNPLQHPNIKALSGPMRGLLRYRVGDWRVVYEVQRSGSGGTAIVLDIAHRSEIYE